MKYIIKIILSIITIFISFLLVVTVIFTLNKKENAVSYVFGFTGFIATGNSMLEKIEAGDFLLVQKKDSYQIGDIISFYNPEEGIINTHRIISISGENYETKGDNNSFVDGYKPTSRVIYGKVIYTLDKDIVMFVFNNYQIILISLGAVLILGFIIGRKYVR